MTRKPFPYNEPTNSRYGAPMGRMQAGGPNDEPIRLTLRRVPLGGDYDNGGAYWGARNYGESLFAAWSRDRSVIRYIDARGLSGARAAILEEFPNARFGT